LKNFVAETRHGAMQKSEKIKKKVLKNGHKDVQSIENNGYKDARHEKNER
jgi:hypothetical protein